MKVLALVIVLVLVVVVAVTAIGLTSYSITAPSANAPVATPAVPTPTTGAPQPPVIADAPTKSDKGDAPVPTPTVQTETAILAGGCFWGMEDILRKIPGVIETDVGYTGGTTPNPTYELMKTGTTGHAEAVRIVFDPKQISYADLLEKWFFKMHDPTTKNRQGNDIGTAYRSAIFYSSDAQKKTAEEVIARVNASGKWPKPIVTEVTPAKVFTNAEGYHQDYLVKNPGGYTCHYMRD